MDYPSIGSGRETSRDMLLLGLIVTVGFVLRFAELGTPGLIRDEALVLVAAEHGPLYIWLRALTTDAHPPYFYFIVKALLFMGHSDFALRLFPAAAGTLSVYLLYRLARRLFDPGTSLLAAALLAAYPLHLQMSRLLRPHPFIVCLTILAMAWLLDFIRDPSRRNLIRLAVLNAALLLFHFNTLLIVGTEAACLLAVLPFASRTAVLRRYLPFLGITALSLLLDLPLLLLRLGKFPGFDLNLSMAWTLTRSVVNLDKMLALFPLPWVNIAGWALFAVGAVSLARTRRLTALYLGAFIVLPLGVLILAKYGLFYEPWHIAFIIPALLLFCAQGAGALLPRRGAVQLAAAMVPCLAAVLFFTVRHEALYAMDSSIFGYEECYKKMAIHLQPHLKSPSAVLFNESFERNFVNWYLRQFTTSDLARNRILPTDPVVSTALVADGPIYSDRDHPEAVRQAADKLLADCGTPVAVNALSCATITAWDIARRPGAVIDALPYKGLFDAYAPDFLRTVFQAENVQILLSPLANTIAPAAYDQPGRFSARFENKTRVKASAIGLDMVLRRAGKGHVFQVSCAYDDEEPRLVFDLPPDWTAEKARIRLQRRKPFTFLTVTVTMADPESNVSFYGISDSIRFEKMDVAVSEPDGVLDADVAVDMEHIGEVETVPEGRFRWGDGPQSAMRFHLDRPEPMRLDMACNNPIPGQTVEILVNGVVMGKVGPLAAQPWLAQTTPVHLDFAGQAGDNVVTLRYGAYNHQEPAAPGSTFAPDDGRPLALAFTTLKLSRAGEQQDSFVVLPR
ncbi:MAG: Dolichyl-phosphate-mannose-protein mannosyltransferase [Solidesulfovibrio magneticus str. Maddingley MBC34]|uniref:Dolichyl-phosphate-mannose-protein mannosyltransferase n=1 Tax=Solidesulfovibrio magneticus str. Maddingley MBC34 TaxID=1206767 RepID=K6GDS3_9BACT|nr:MAG: Dolichyl-phosphate-mannose-protein mannosyltransferase [Solidesulfovibrio magneticus str. Maddingley MBC34]